MPETDIETAGKWNSWEDERWFARFILFTKYQNRCLKMRRISHVITRISIAGISSSSILSDDVPQSPLIACP
jgi:hypothetical protein